MQDRAGSTTRERVSQAAASVMGWVRSLAESIVRRGRRSSLRRLQLIESLDLGNRRQLFLIACDDQPFLVGAGADRVGTLVAVPMGLSEPNSFPSGVGADRATGATGSAHPARLSPFYLQRSHLRQRAQAGETRGLQLVRAAHEDHAMQGTSAMDKGKRLWP